MAICSMPKKELTSTPLLTRNEFDYLNSEKSLSKKMYIMADMLSLTRDDHCEREEIVSYLFNLLRPYYPECDILVFGSSANGFGFRNCDLDLLFLPFPDYCNLDFKDKECGSIPSPYNVLKDAVSIKRLYLMNEEMHLKFIKQVMYGTTRFFKKIFFIPAKCPILSLEFTTSHLQCDFSASNRLVLYNTQLLWLYGKLDSRVKPLVMFLRYWAKSLSFISKSRLSSYCLTLMVIFYLQNTHPAILPSVRYLNELAGYSRVIDGWETAICLDPKCINANQYRNSKSLTELLIDFFDFYWNFDFVQNIVSVYDGEPLPVKLMAESEDERNKSFLVTPFSVQDPFILSRNISRNATMKTAFKFSLMIAKNLCLQRHFDFTLLFDSTYYQDTINSMFASTKKTLQPSPMFLTLQLTYEIYKKLAITPELKQWYDKVSQHVLDILQHGLLIECEIVDKAICDDNLVEPPHKKRKFNIEDKGGLKLIISIQCIVNFPTLWRHNRVEVLEHLKKTAPNFELEQSEDEIPASLRTEHIISKELSKDETKNVTKLPDFAPPYFSFTCNCFRYCESQIPDIVISFSSLTNAKTYGGTKEFLKSFVMKQIKTFLQEA